MHEVQIRQNREINRRKRALTKFALQHTWSIAHLDIDPPHKLNPIPYKKVTHKMNLMLCNPLKGI